jgi:hypothetical protein
VVCNSADQVVGDGRPLWFNPNVLNLKQGSRVQVLGLVLLSERGAALGRDGQTLRSGPTVCRALSDVTAISGPIRAWCGVELWLGEKAQQVQQSEV